jgi:lysophospholipid acyltransferase (LPLAT)-like uncharacterized protein
MSSQRHGSNPFRWYDRILLQIIPPVAAFLIKALMLSCRVVKVKGREREREVASRTGRSAVYASWHQRMPYLSHAFGSYDMIIMVSQSRDGEYAARIALWLGFRNVRGSSTHGGSRALREVVRRIKSGETCGLFADGPQGPARVAKAGTPAIARSAGVPLIPVTWGADRCWVFNSWDRYLVPKPFSRVAMYYGEPIRIPSEARGQELEKYRLLLEEALNEATRWCDTQFGPERPWRKVTEMGIPEVGPL